MSVLFFFFSFKLPPLPAAQPTPSTPLHAARLLCCRRCFYSYQNVDKRLQRRAAEVLKCAFTRVKMQMERGQLGSEGCWWVSQQPPGQAQEADWTHPEPFNARLNPPLSLLLLSSPL